MKKNRIKKTNGFTLIEVLISMAIFVSFVAVLMTSYTGIVRGQRDANEYRMLYSEARSIFDKLADEIKNSAIYYPETTRHDLVLLSKDGTAASRFVFEEDEQGICFAERIDQSYLLNSEGVSVTAFNVFVSPSRDPYLLENVYADSLQFQPKVTIFARFAKVLGNGNIFEMDLSTSISSRIYGPIVAVADLIIPTPDCSGTPSLNPLEEF